MMLVDDPSGPATLGSGENWTSVSHNFGPMKLDFRASSGFGRAASGIGIGTGGDANGEAGPCASATLRSRTPTRRSAARCRAASAAKTARACRPSASKASASAGGWVLSGALEAADARVDALNVSGLWTSAWSLSAQHPFAGGALRFTAAQPRRAEGGELAFNAPIEVTRTGAILYEPRIAGLTPSGRELDFETAWSTRLGDMTTLEAAAAVMLQPNHVADAEPETAVWLSLRHAW